MMFPVERHAGLQTLLLFSVSEFNGTVGEGDRIQVVCDQLTGFLRSVVVSANHGRKTFDTLRDLVHPGTQAPIHLIMGRFDWNGLQKDVREWTRCCIPCRITKVHRHNKALIGTFDVPDDALTMCTST